MTLRPVGLVEVDHFWPLIAERVARYCDKAGGDVTPAALFQLVRNGQALLFRVGTEFVHAAVICRVEQWKTKTVLNVICLVGWNMEAWLQHMLEDRDWLTRLGVESVVFQTRTGMGSWGRKIPQARCIAQTFELDVTHG